MMEIVRLLSDQNRILSHIEIQRFRGLKKLSLTNAGKINLVVGRNDAGKTSLLESIRLLISCDPRYLRRANRNRMERKSISIEQSSRLAFFEAQSDVPMLLTGELDSLHLSAQVSIERVQVQSTVPLNLEEEEEVDETIESLLQPDYEIVLEVQTNGGAKAIIRQSMGEQEAVWRQPRREMTGASFPKIPPLVWLGTNRAEIWAHARRYSHLYRAGGEELLLEILREIEPRLKSLVVLTNPDDRASASAVLEVDLGLARTLPLDSMGDGFSSVIAIVSAIGTAENGICLIDEVENGIHYSLLPQMWRSAATAAQKYNTQIWATTHSYDCITAIHEALSDMPEMLRVHRLDRRQDGDVVVHTFDHAMLGRALERGLEVR